VRYNFEKEEDTMPGRIRDWWVFQVIRDCWALQVMCAIAIILWSLCCLAYFYNQPRIGETGLLYEENHPMVLLAKYPEQTWTDRNDEQMRCLVRKFGMARFVPDGVRARVIDSEPGCRKVRVIEGRHAGVEGWLPRELIVRVGR